MIFHSLFKLESEKYFWTFEQSLRRQNIFLSLISFEAHLRLKSRKRKKTERTNLLSCSIFENVRIILDSFLFRVLKNLRFYAAHGRSSSVGIASFKRSLVGA